MKYSFAKHSEFVTLGEELDKVRAYLEIAKSRFGSRLSVSIDLEPDILEHRIPVFSIQPLVENAVQHGLFPKLTDCVLTIKAYRQKAAVYISVTDNGIGIESGKLTKLYTSETEGIGIQNVHGRLTGIYGENYGLAITSTPGSGTAAVIRIPSSTEVSAHAG